MSNILIGITNIVLFFFWGLFVGGPTFDIKAPATVKAGESFTVDVTIKKGDYKEFARFLHKLPEGFTATEVENDGGKFLFENGEVKLIWYSAPSKNELKISYKVTVAPDATGEKQITGKYSFLENGYSTAVATDPVTIMVTTGSTPIASGNDNTTPATTPVDSMAKPEAVVTVKRSVPVVPGDNFEVELLIDKADLQSFAKVEETLPAGFTATAVKTDGATFEVEGQKVKFVWYSLPKKNLLRISYKVSVAPGTYGDQNITGTFSYVENEKGKNTDIASTLISLPIPAEPVVSNPTKNPVDTTTGNTSSENKTPVTNTENTAGNTNTTNNTGNTTAGTNNTSNTGNENSTTNPVTSNTTADPVKTPVTTVPAAQTGVSYRIQIAAMSRNVEAAEFANRFNISERIDAEMHQGLNKYLVGNFNAYQEARNKREDIRGKGASDAFVTAYNTGRRITVQEALMISSQTWVR